MPGLPIPLKHDLGRYWAQCSNGQGRPFSRGTCSMTGTYNLWLVLFSILVAIYVSHTALSLSARVARVNAESSGLWLAGGAVAMGCGIWAMHFIGMLAFSLPIALAYDIFLTTGSLVIAIA